MGNPRDVQPNRPSPDSYEYSPELDNDVLLPNGTHYFTCDLPSLKRRPSALRMQLRSFYRPLGLWIDQREAEWLIVFCEARKCDWD